MHLQFLPLDGLPAALHLAREYTASERDVLRGALAPGYVYLADRGYEPYALYNAVQVYCAVIACASSRQAAGE